MSKVFKIVIPLVIIFLTIGVVGSFYIIHQLQPVDPTQTKKISFTITAGEAASEIGKQLEEKGFIKSADVFRLLIWKNNLTQNMQKGSFLLSPSMTSQQISLEITTEPSSLRLTIKEGLRKEEIADYLADSDLEAFDRSEFMTLIKSKEGFLYPDTYIFSREASTQAVFNQLTNTFDKKVVIGMSDEIATSGRTLDQLVAMASLIQREARGPQAGSSDPIEMKMISGILWKRIELGMILNVDASLQYIKGYDSQQKSWWSTNGIVALKASSSPYNSYKVAGLPPTPICNPGPYALKAAMQPTTSSYLYYLHDNQGRVHYAATLEEHNQNVDAYLR